MDKWDRIKEIFIDIIEWVAGAIIFFTYGHEIGVFLGDGYERFRRYYGLLFVFSALDVILVFIGLLFPWSTCVGVGFVIAIVIFVLSWTPVALALVGVDKATKGKLGKYKLFPPIFGTIVFWICGIGLVATMYPEIISMLFLVISCLVAVALLALWHSLGLKTHFQEWAMLMVVLLMVGIFVLQKALPRFYGDVENRVTSWLFWTQDRIRTPVPTKFDSKVFDAKDKVWQMEINAVNAELDKVINSMDATKVDSSYLNPNKPQEKLKEIARLEARRDELIKQRAEAKLSPSSGTSGTTTTSGSGRSIVKSSGGGISPRAIAVFVVILLAGLLVVGIFTRKISFSQLIFAVAVVGIGLVVAWYHFAPPVTRLTIYQQGYKVVPVLGPDFEVRHDVWIKSVPSDVVLYWYKSEYELGNPMEWGTQGGGTKGYPLVAVIKDADLVKMGGVKKRGAKSGIEGVVYTPL